MHQASGLYCLFNAAISEYQCCHIKPIINKTLIKLSLGTMGEGVSQRYHYQKTDSIFKIPARRLPDKAKLVEISQELVNLATFPKWVAASSQREVS